MDYRKKLYSNYISTHTSHLYGEVSLNRIRKQFPIWRKYFAKFLPQDKEAKILDLGCGQGGFVYWLQTLGYKNTWGIDISDQQIEVAKSLGIENIKQADLKKFLPGKRETYNLIFARDVLEHFRKEEILGILNLVYNSLSGGGKFVMQSPNAEGLFWGRYRYADFTHEVAFTRTSLSQILRAAGFKEIEFYPTGPVPHGLKSLIRYLLWKIIEAKIKLYLLIETGNGKGIFTQNLIAVAEK